MATTELRGSTQVRTASVPLAKLANATAEANIIVANASLVPVYVAMSGDITITAAGVTAIGAGKVTSAMLAGSIAASKIALADGKVLIGNASGVAVENTLTGDVTVSNTGVTAIASGVIVNADINASAAIDYSKLNIADGNLTIAKTSGLQAALDSKVDENAAITGATKTKITYDAKGLVTAGADATTADIADSTDKRYVTDADLVDIGNLSGINTGDQTITLTGHVTGSGTGSFATTISTGVITNAMVMPGAGIVYSKLSIADGDLTIAKTSGLQAALDSKVDENAAITGATKTKITYDAKGLVTAGVDATAADIVNTPAGNIAATDVQAALNELDTEKEPVFSKGNLTEAVSSVLTLSNLSSRLYGATGATIEVKQASASQAGYLSSSDWTAFNTKVNRSGDTMTGNLVMSTGTDITLPDAPAAATDAVNKQYVDNLVSAGASWIEPIQNPDWVGVADNEPTSPLASGMYIKWGGTQNETWGAITNVVDEDLMHYVQGAWQRSGNLAAGHNLLVGVWTDAIDNDSGEAMITGVYRDDYVRYVGSDPSALASWDFPYGRSPNHPGWTATGNNVDTITISGSDQTASFKPGNIVEFNGNTFTIVSASFSTDTTIVVSGNPGSGSHTVYARFRNGGTTTDLNTADSHYAQTFLYSEGDSQWVQIAGPGAIGAGVGLAYSGTTLNIQLGAGIKELPTDEVGVDVHTSGGLMTTVDGTTSSTVTGAQLGIKLDASTLTLSSSGLKVSTGGIANNEVAAGAGIVYSKLSIADGDLTIAKTSGLQAALDSKVDENAAITGATKTKITYDAKGLVTAGADATAADIVNTPAGNIAATTVQAALNELDTEKVAKAGDTMTGPLEVDSIRNTTDNTTKLDLTDTSLSLKVGGVESLEVVGAAVTSRVRFQVPRELSPGDHSITDSFSGAFGIRIGTGEVAIGNAGATEWLKVGPTNVTAKLPVDVDSNKIINLANGTNPADAVNFSQLDAKLDKNTAITGATKTKITYDADGLVTAGTDATAADIVNTPAGSIAATTVQAALNELDTEKVAKAGDTMTGALTVNAGIVVPTGQDITLTDVPSAGTDAVNKTYADGLITGFFAAHVVKRAAVTGTINGSNKVFTIAGSPTIVTGSEDVYLNGMLLNAGSGNDYTISGATITFDASFPAPTAGDLILVSYWY